MDAPAMNIARDMALLAYPACEPSSPTGSPAIMIYQPQVALAALITNPAFLEVTCSTTTPGPQRKSYIAAQLARATGYERNRIGKALQYMWIIIDNLTEYLRATEAGHRTFTDTAHDLLPYLCRSTECNRSQAGVEPTQIGVPD
jgi:hypothetical protein